MRRILVVKLADLGDLLTATPALRALRNAHPRAHIAALVTPGSAQILHGSSAVDEVILFEKSAFDRIERAPTSLSDALDLARRLRAGRWDALALLHHLTTPFGAAKYSALSLASGAPIRAGLDNGRGWFLTHRVTDRGFGDRHEADYWMAVAAALGGRNEMPRLEVHLDVTDHAWADQALGRIGAPPTKAAIIHPGSGGFGLARRWPADRFGAVADLLAAEHGLHPIVLRGPAQGECDVAARAAAGGKYDVLGPAPSATALAALLSRVRLVVGNDSGVMHLATAVGTPTVAVFGPTNDRAWGPYPPDLPRHAVVRDVLACSPCTYRGHSLGTPQGCAARTCLDLIEPAHVISAAERVLAASARPDPAPTGATEISS